jgi:hypothetical protein
MREMNNQNISMSGRDAHMNIICAWTLLQSFMSIVWSCFRHIFYERVHKRTMNPGPLLIIRNNFPTLYHCFHFQYLLNLKIHFFIYYTCKPKHYTAIFYCLSLYCIFLWHKNFLGTVAIAYLLIRIAYFILVLYTYTHLVLDNHLVRLRTQSKFILFCRLLEEG